MKFKMSLIVEDTNGNGLEVFDFDSCNALESKLEEMGEKYPFVIEAEHLTIITLKVGNYSESVPLPEEAFAIAEYPEEKIGPEEEYLEEVVEESAHNIIEDEPAED